MLENKIARMRTIEIEKGETLTVSPWDWETHYSLSENPKRATLKMFPNNKTPRNGNGNIKEIPNCREIRIEYFNKVDIYFK